MKNRKRLENTTDSREYKLVQRLGTLRCAICPPHKGENANMSGKTDLRCWKRYRDKQFKR